MHKKIIYLFLVAYFIIPRSVLANTIEYEYLDIVSREEWGANEEYTYLDSEYWNDIIKKRKEYSKNLTPKQQKNAALKSKILSDKIDYINEFYSPLKIVTRNQTHEQGRPLAWPIEKTDYVHSIVIHHTETDNIDDLSNINNILKFHSISRQWGDIGYNYLIGKDGTIYEGRKGGDYAMGAHALWNNAFSAGISLMGSYSDKPINQKQYEALDKLIKHLSLKYGIDLSKKVYYHRECTTKDNCDYILNTMSLPAMVGHRDIGHTSCPGGYLYKQMQDLRVENLYFTKGFSPIKRGMYNSNLEMGYIANNSVSSSWKSIINHYTSAEREYYIFWLQKGLVNNLFEGQDRKKILTFWRMLYKYDNLQKF